MSGEIPVCREISLEMNRIDARIANPNYYYDPRPVEGWVRFCEGELTKTDGTSLDLLDTFKLWGEQLFGWYYYSERAVYNTKSRRFETELIFKRLISKQYLIVARGAAKTMYISNIQSAFLIVDPETTHQITVAPTMKQAEEVLSPIRTAITRTPGPLLTFLTSTYGAMRNKSNYKGVMIASTKKGIENFLTGSILEIRPMSIDKLQGLRTAINTVDEWLSSDVIREDVIGAIEQGASKLEDYLIVAVSSEGTVRDGAGDDIKLELMSILTGEYDDPHTSIFHYKLDSVDEVSNPEMWVKAQPNIGKTVTYETYSRDVKRAEKVPSTRNDVLAKRFGLPMHGFTYFFTYEETIPHTKKHSFRGMECALGADMSQGDDFCSFTFLFPIRTGEFGIKSINFISERTLHALPPSARIKYESFIKEGSLIVMEGSILDMDSVFYVLLEEIQSREYEVVALGYDPYNADVFVKLWKRAYGEFSIESVAQGVRTESVPLGELKKLAEDRMLLFDESIFSYAMGNAMVLEDTNGNRKIFKRRYANKIDPVAAAMDAYVVYSRRLELFN